MEKVRVIVYGLGSMGSLISKFLLEKEGIDIVGAIDIAKDKVGKDLGDVLGLERKFGIKVLDDVNSLLSKISADVAIHATSSHLKDVYPQIVSLIKHGVSVISTCEELSYPYFSEPKLAKKLNTLAKKYNVTILGTGINPGFLMDTLVITLTAVCHKIEKIEAIRVINAATRRLSFQKKIGAGLSVQEFKEKVKSKQITGNIGLKHSIAMIADALAWELDGISEYIEPIVSNKSVESKEIKIKAGEVAGLRHKAKGTMKNGKMIVLDYQAYIGAEDEYDAVRINGIPNVNEKIQPCVNGDIGTAAIVINSIPKVLNASGGLFTMKDLPLPSATTVDMRKYIKHYRVKSL